MKCLECTAPMELQEQLKTSNPYRIRRFICPVCGHQETIFANGTRDMIVDPRRAIEAIKKGYKQEEDNNDFTTF